MAEGGAGLAVDLSQIEAAATLAGTPIQVSTTLDAIVAAKDGAFVAVSVPADAFADAAELEREMTGLSRDEMTRRCAVLGGFTANLLELDDTDRAAEFADCSGWLAARHPVTGEEKLVAAPWRVEGRRPGFRKHAPVLGEDDEFVLRRILSLEGDEIERLRKAGVVGVPAGDEPTDKKATS